MTTKHHLAGESAAVVGVFDDIPEEVYHGDRGSLSVSGAKLLLPPSCPAKFKWQLDNARAPKKVWDFGHVFHRIILGKGGDFFILDPAVHGLKKDNTIADSPAQTAGWKQAAAEARERGETPIHIDDFRRAQAMVASVLNHPEAGPIFDEGLAEQSLYWVDPVTGVQLRGRTDWLRPGEIADPKTSLTANPVELKRKFWSLGYFQQAAWYRDLVIALGVDENPRFRFIAVEKEPPHVVTVVEYDDDAIAEGRRLNRLAIETYARCRDADVWPGYSDTTVSLSLPGWVLRDGQQAEIQADADSLIAELEAMTS